MNTHAEKIQLTKWILDTDNPQILKTIKNIFIEEQNMDFWASLTHEQKEDIELGISEIFKGEVIDYNAFMSKHRG